MNMIRKFLDYQIEWLTLHCDIELESELEQLIIRFLKNTAKCFMEEYEDMEVDDGK